MEDPPLSNARLSYVHGASDIPLIGSTIGELFDRVVTTQCSQTAGA